MNVVKYEPFGLFNQWFDSGRAEVARPWVPTVDIREAEDAYVLRADLPGIDPKAIEITADNGVLTIKGERKTETDSETDGYRHSERVYGSFRRSFSLPRTVDSAAIRAKGENGVLEITVPKAQEAQSRRISVN